MTTKEVYVAYDGTEFYDEDKCKGHTQRVNRSKQIERFYASDKYMIYFNGAYIRCHMMILACPNIITYKQSNK